MASYACFLTGLVFFNTIYVTLAANVDFKQLTDMLIFVSPSGSDVAGCGRKAQPCESVKFVLGRVVDSNTTSVMITVLPGVYSPEAVKMDCSVGSLRRVVIQGLQETVKIGISADIVKCNVVFANLHWTNTTKHILINSIIATITIINSTISDIGFSLLSSGSNITIVNSSIKECSGWQPLFPLLSTSGVASFHTQLSLLNSTISHNKSPLVSIKSTSVTIQNVHFISNTVLHKEELLVSLSGVQGSIIGCNFARNIGTNVKIFEGSIVNMTGTMFDGNNVLDGSLIDIGQDGTLRASLCSFIKSYGTSKGPVVKMTKDDGVANFTRCYFSCNQVNGSANVSPIKTDGKNVMNFKNCTTDHHCPVFCNSGEYLVNGIMCVSCPSGAYSPGSGYNITTFSCKKCDPGYYNSKKGSSSCQPCIAGSYAAKPGSTKCTPCKNSLMTSSKGQPSCSHLTIGFIVLTTCVILLILIPLVTLLIQYLQTNDKWTSNKPKDYSRLYGTIST